MEDLKERYYSICGKLTKVRAASGTEPKIYIFDAGHERRRKEQLEKLFNRTPEQVSDMIRFLFGLLFMKTVRDGKNMLRIDSFNGSY